MRPAGDQLSGMKRKQQTLILEDGMEQAQATASHGQPRPATAWVGFKPMVC